MKPWLSVAWVVGMALLGTGCAVADRLFACATRARRLLALLALDASRPAPQGDPSLTAYVHADAAALADHLRAAEVGQGAAFEALLGERLTSLQGLAIACVVAASLGSALGAPRDPAPA